MNVKFKYAFLLSFLVVIAGCTKNDLSQNVINADSVPNTKNVDKYSSIIPPTVTIKVGKTFKFSAKIELIDGSLAIPKKISWVSANPYAVQVAADGTITGMNEGFAIVTAKSKDDPTRKATATVNVEE